MTLSAAGSDIAALRLPVKSTSIPPESSVKRMRHSLIISVSLAPDGGILGADIMCFRAVSCILVKGTPYPLNKNPEFVEFISTFGIFFCLFNSIGGRMRALAHCFRFFAPFLLHILLMVSLNFILCYMSIPHCRTNLRVSEYGLDRFNRHALINGSSSHRMPETMRNNVLHPALF